MFVRGKTYRRRDLHKLYRGQQRGGISTPAAQPFVMLFTGGAGQAYGYRDGWSEEGLFLYTGEGHRGDMLFVRGNRAIRDHIADGKDLYLFEQTDSGSVRYMGQMVCIGFHERRGPDMNGYDRRAIIFELVPLEEFNNKDFWSDALLDEQLWKEQLVSLRERAITFSDVAKDPIERKNSAQRRSDEVRTYVLRRARGACEACGDPAPFKTDSGRPYLETHHIRRLSDGGPDHPRWVVALCPNCHQRAHHSEDKELFGQQLARIANNKETDIVPMFVHQLSLLPGDPSEQVDRSKPYRERLIALLSENLDFHGHDSGYASHNFHSFPAKFPPQLPRTFIRGLTDAGDTVLDPMSGSGTTVLEALFAGRQAIGFDIDPLALLVARVKTASLDAERVTELGMRILTEARLRLKNECVKLQRTLDERWDAKSRQFVDYWFAPETQLELLALITEIERIPDKALREFFELAFSSTIITKSGGVSLSLDLAHTRPHRAKVVFGKTGQVVLGAELVDSTDRRVKFLTKTLRSALEEFEKRLRQNARGLLKPWPERIEPHIALGNTQDLPLNDGVIDLVVTSPPYASNAIDYMRAHKFSLVWMGHPIDELGQKRGEYIGGESVTGIEFEQLPDRAAQVVAKISDLDEKKGRVLHRYYSEMKRTLMEMFRVLRPGKAAILVVGSSRMRGQNTETDACLVDIGSAIGFQVPQVGIRHLDRNRRMMPAGAKLNLQSQIQQRMHEEYVIGFYKPKGKGL